MTYINTPLMKKVLHITQRKRISDIQHYSQTNDLGTGFEITEWGMFCHQARLQISPARFKQGYSDSAPLAVMELPKRYRQRLRTSNMQERLIREVRRRERVICIFPGEPSALRMVGAVLAEINEEWQNRRYFDMAEFKEWKAEREAKQETENVIKI
jgi:hypothetical protein